METAEEPQKKVFKARKTMKASDRHQLEAVHKAKVLLKSAEVKLVNGIHENGNSDMNYTRKDKEPMEDSKNLNGILDINCDALEIPVVKLSDLRDSLKHIDKTSDLKLSFDLGLAKSTVFQGDGNTIGPAESTIQTDSTQQEQDEIIPHEGVEQIDSNELFEENLSCEPESSEEHTQPDIPNEEENCMVTEDTSKPEDENPVENSPLRELENEDLNIISETPIDNSGNIIEESNINEPLEPETVDSGNDVEKDDLSAEEQENEASNDELHSELENTEETEKNAEEQESTEVVNESHDTNVSPDMNVEENGSPLEDKRETSESKEEQNDFGDEAISSSMEVDHNVQNIEPVSPLPADSPVDKAPSDAQVGSELENTEEMETDEIIPILEKLAPIEDELQCFSEDKSDFETVSDKEERAENITASPSKNDTSETLPSEAFLVLSDEEEPCGESTPLKESMLTDQDEVKEVIAEPEEKPADEHAGPETKDEPQAEKSELSQRKRSKSEDLDSQSSKRRRFEGEEYEAELKVKITAGNDLNEKLQKVIQKMFEEKLSALQCLDFDKALAELKSRVEKIECKKHETSLRSMQTKITRLTKRFGAAKEDLKKRSEPTAKPPSSPVKSAVNDSALNPNIVNIRNVGTVRQMLETKRNVPDTAPVSIQTSPAAPSSTPSSSNLTLRTSSTTQMPVNQSPLNNMLQSRQPPDWKLIQQKINAATIGASQNTQSSQSKSMTPVTSAPVITPVLSAPTTATVVGNSQVSTSNTQPVSVSLQSLPVILHVPQLLQGATGTLVTNQQSGNVEFIPVQNQSTVNSLAKTPVSLPVTKSMNSPSMPSSGLQRNSSASTVNSPMAVQAMPMSHSVALSSRQSLPNVGTTGMYNQASNRNTAQLKSTVPTFSSSSTTEAPSGSRSDLQINRTTNTTTTTAAAETASSKRSSADGSAVSGKPGVIDLTLDDEDAETSTHDSRRSNPSSVPATVQSSQPVGRQSQPVQTNTVQTSPASAVLPPQATIHVLPTAQTTVNITQRPGTQAAPRAAAPRAPNNPHMVYTTTALPTVPVQTPVRNTVMQSQNLRQISPQTAGASVRMPQTAAYVVNNGIPVGSSGPQLTVHHRPPQEPTRPIHPAPLPEAPQPQRLPPEAASTSPPQKPHLKLARVQSQNGIVLSWSVLEVDRTCAIVDSYHLYAYHEDPTATSSSQWKKIGEVKALPLPMACTLTQFVSGSKYYFAVRAKDVYGRFGPFCDPQSTDVISTQSS
ncbi:activating transcription factor 7-interacting protein 1 isoform X2 [Phyllobates terribilis]|uniref:activating transcription factor 7-interacting protein 1 isoform X2 n=1 Tax=Phyllobates terribilis TaxID=111132 RepID=UPI003CCB5C80